MTLVYFSESSPPRPDISIGGAKSQECRRAGRGPQRPSSTPDEDFCNASIDEDVTDMLGVWHIDADGNTTDRPTRALDTGKGRGSWVMKRRTALFGQMDGDNGLSKNSDDQRAHCENNSSAFLAGHRGLGSSATHRARPMVLARIYRPLISYTQIWLSFLTGDT